jgi:hypothetical protein
MSKYTDELTRIFKVKRYEAEMADSAGRVVAAELGEDLEMEALRRIRAKTHSIVLQYQITDVLEDGWVADEGNSAVQPYKG